MAVSKVLIKIYETNIGMLIVSADRPRIDQILANANVIGGTYAVELVERIYHFLIGRATDFRKEYEEYYSCEYEDFRAFLYRKHCLSKKWLRKLSNAIETGAFIGLVHSRWGQDYQIESLLEHDDKFDVVRKIIGAE